MLHGSALSPHGISMQPVAISLTFWLPIHVGFGHLMSRQYEVIVCTNNAMSLSMPA